MSDVCMRWALKGKISLSVTLQDQAAALHAMGMMGYSELKSRLMSTTAFLVATGSLIAFSAGGSQAAYPFAVGGSAALGYQWLLQQSVDSIPSKLPRRTLVKVSTCSLQLFFAAQGSCPTCLSAHLSSCELLSRMPLFCSVQVCTEQLPVWDIRSCYVS